VAIGLRITDATGVLVVTLSTTDVKIQPPGYAMIPGDPEMDATVTESVTIWWKTRATGIDNLELLGQLFAQAERYAATKLGARVYVEFCLDAATPDWFRSQLVPARPGDPAGRVTPSPGSLNVELSAGHLTAKVQWTRQYYWEDSDETVALLTNTNGTDQAFLNIDNHEDIIGAGIHQNRVTFNIGRGDLPTPLRVQFQMQSTPTTYVKDIYAGLHQWAGGAPYDHALEAEDSGDPGGATVAVTPFNSVTASGDNAGAHGQFMRATWTLGTEIDLYSWTIASAQGELLGGAFYRLMARFDTSLPAYTDLYFRARVYAVIGAQTQLVQDGKSVIAVPGDNLVDLGVLRLPPYPYAGAPASFQIRISGHRVSGVASTVDLDFVHLLPVEAGYKHYYPIQDNLGLVDTAQLVDDGMSGELYQLPAGSTNKAFSHKGDGTTFFAYPDRAYRMIALWSQDDEDHIIGEQMTIRVAYRARRLTIGPL
jgi:hypothetical protein